MNRPDTTAGMLADQVDAQASYWIAAIDFVNGVDPDDIDVDADTLAEIAETYADGSDFDVLNTDALSVEYEWRGSSRESAEIDTVRIVLATGGPHVEIVIRRGRGAEIVGYWGSETVSRYFDHPATLAMADDLAEIAEMSTT